MCFQESDFNEHALDVSSWFLKEDYSQKIINTEMSKFKFNVVNKRLNNTQKIPFVVTFHPKLKVLRDIINKHLYLLDINYEIERVFTPKPMVSFRSIRKISSCLVNK